MLGYHHISKTIDVLSKLEKEVNKFSIYTLREEQLMKKQAGVLSERAILPTGS